KSIVHELLIADDHTLFREALKGFISKYYPNTRIHEAERASDLYPLVEAHPDADLLLLDLNMPDTVGFNALIYLRNEYPALPVAIISAHETDRKSTRLNSSHVSISYAVFCLKKKRMSPCRDACM